MKPSNPKDRRCAWPSAWRPKPRFDDRRGYRSGNCPNNLCWNLHGLRGLRGLHGFRGLRGLHDYYHWRDPGRLDVQGCDFGRGAYFGSMATPSLDIPVCDFCRGAYLGSRATPSLDIPVCDFCRGAYFGSRATPSLDIPVCDFCRGAYFVYYLYIHHSSLNTLTATIIVNTIGPPVNLAVARSRFAKLYAIQMQVEALRCSHQVVRLSG